MNYITIKSTRSNKITDFRRGQLLMARPLYRSAWWSRSTTIWVQVSSVLSLIQFKDVFRFCGTIFFSILDANRATAAMARTVMVRFNLNFELNNQKQQQWKQRKIFADACQNFCLNDGVCKKNPIGENMEWIVWMIRAINQNKIEKSIIQVIQVKWAKHKFSSDLYLVIMCFSVGH